MQPDDILWLHDLFMKKYKLLGESEEHGILARKFRELDAGRSRPQVDDIRAVLLNFVTEQLSVSVLGEDTGGRLVGADVDKIDRIALAAYDRANAYLSSQNLNIDVDAYKHAFKEAYDAALRLEIYREYCGRNQGKESDLRTKFIREKAQIPGHITTLFDYVVYDSQLSITNKFSQFKNMHDDPSSKLDQLDRNKIQQMQDQLGAYVSEFFLKTTAINSSGEPEEKKLKACQNAALVFQIKAGQLIRSHQVKAESDEQWAPFLKNLLLIITGIGVLLTAVSLITKAASGKYLFFDKPVVRQTPQAEKAVEDKLLDLNYNETTSAMCAALTRP